MKQAVILLFISLVLSGSAGGKLAPEFKTCKRDSENFKECLKDAIEDAFAKLDNGIPSLKVPPLEPLSIPRITIGEGKSSTVLTYTNYKLYGIRATKIKEIDVNLTPTSFVLKLETFTPETRTEAHYNIKGTALSLPITGDGNCTITLYDLKSKLSIQGDTFEKGGKKYLKSTEFAIDLTPGKVTYNFENLFNGNKRLGEEMNKLMNENWKEIYEEVDGDFNLALQIVFQDYANKIFTQVPYDELF